MQRTLILVGVLLAAVGAEAPAAPFVAVDATTTPDQLMVFDTGEPARVTPFPTPLEGSFIRGLDLSSEFNGFYLAMQSDDNSESGFFQLERGVPSKVADVPFETSALGGLTFNQAQDGMFAALNPPGQQQTLFSIGLDGGFDEVGPIVVEGSGSSDISGLALHPITGILYGLDNRSRSLVEIDPDSGLASIVGNGLGIPARFGGGMDFTFDGSQLFIATNAGRVYEVDPTTGAAGRMLGNLPFATTAIAAVPEPACGMALLTFALLSLRRRSAGGIGRRLPPTH